MDVCDAHVHFFSHEFFCAMARQKTDLTIEPMDNPAEIVTRMLNWTTPPAEPRELAANWVKELDRHGVSRAALIASVPGDEMSVAEAVAWRPNRFYGYCMVNPLAADALDRVERALSAGLRGICLFPAMHRYPINDPRVEPILETASTRTGVVIFVHCGLLTVGIRGK